MLDDDPSKHAPGEARRDPVTPHRLWQFAILAGALAGLMSWGIGEVLFHRLAPTGNQIIHEAALHHESTLSTSHRLWRRAVDRISTFGYATSGALLGGFLGALGCLTRRSGTRLRTIMPLGILIGGLAGSLASEGMLSSYHRYRDRVDSNRNKGDMSTPVLVHVAIWTAIGAAGGAALGFGRWERAALSAIGGASGSGIAAVLFVVGGVLVIPLGETTRLVPISIPTRLVIHLALAIFGAAGAAWALLHLRAGSRNPSRTLRDGP